MEQHVLNQLYEDFPVEIKPGKGAFKYVRTRNILDRLNKAFSGNWGTHIMSHSEIGEEVLVHIAVYVYDDKGNILSQQQGFGSAKKFPGVELGNTYKSATSKAIKSAVRNWGVALFLDEEDGETSPVQSGGGMPSGMPGSNPSTPINNMPSSMPSTPGMPSTSPIPSTPSSMPNMPSNVPSAVSANSVPSSVPTNTLPSMPSMSTPTSGLISNQEVQQVASMAQQNDSSMAITGVQKVAIASKLSAKQLKFEDLCNSYFPGRSIGSIDELTYNDALSLVSFLNSK